MDSGGGEQVTRTEPPAYVKPYIVGDPSKNIIGVLPEAQRLYESNKPAYFPGSTVAGFSPEQELGLTGLSNRAMMGSPLNDAAGGYLEDVIGGKYLGGASLDPVSEALWGQVAPRVNSAAGLAGRAGSGAHEGVLGREFTNALAPYAFNQYQAERGLQQQAAGMAPQQAAQDYVDLNALLGVGAQRQQQGQAELSDEVARWNFGQNIDQQKLDNFIRAVYGAPGSTTYQSQPSNGGAGLMGGLFSAGAAALPFIFSDVNMKERIEPVDDGDIIDKMADLPIYEWSYKGDPERHTGPMAQDWQRVTGKGDGKTIHLADVTGAMLSLAKAIAKDHRRAA